MADAPARCEVMGVLNVTPDSFSDGGRYTDPSIALERACELLDEGADWIDVGGESTRPGAEPVDPAEEQRRVLPVVEAVADLCRGTTVRVSIDTRHAGTARAAVAAGAAMVNDVTASLWPVAAELGVPWVAMHMAGAPATMQDDPRYDDVVDEVRAFLALRAAEADIAGVPEVRVDPGIGFGKTTTHNLTLLARIGELVADGRPVLVGTSRKRFTGELLARSDRGEFRPDGPRGAVGGAMMHPEPPEAVPTEDRLVGSLATATWAMIHGARTVRVHDVRSTVRAARALLDGPVAPGR